MFDVDGVEGVSWLFVPVNSVWDMLLHEGYVLATGTANMLFVKTVDV